MCILVIICQKVTETVIVMAQTTNHFLMLIHKTGTFFSLYWTHAKHKRLYRQFTFTLYLIGNAILMLMSVDIYQEESLLKPPTLEVGS